MVKAVLKKTRFAFLMLTFAVLISLTGFTACSSNRPAKTEMRVLCAGSLMIPLEAIEEAYEARHPDIDVLIEGHGSIQVIRHVTELYEEADVVAVADYSLIPMMMYDATIPDTGESYASWHVKFATNSLGIAYSPSSAYADEINEDNWYEILSRTEVRLGISDPRLDACGYRALMLLYLAESYYNDSTIFENVLGAFNPPVEVYPGETSATITVPEILNPLSERIILRGSSIRLLALLESGDTDYSFEYRSVAEQHNLNFLSLPPEIDLSTVEQTDAYGQVSCRMDFRRFASVQPEFTGQPIIYGITIPANAPHHDAAVEFLEFMLGVEGQQIFSQHHHPPLAPAEADDINRTPTELVSLLKQG
jgi:molybdate/tungstate transport system substrate-binding protein